MEPKNENAAWEGRGDSLKFVLRTIRPLWGELRTRQGQTGNEPAV